jgi:hypothetical protein
MRKNGPIVSALLVNMKLQRKNNIAMSLSVMHSHFKQQGMAENSPHLKPFRKCAVQALHITQTNKFETKGGFKISQQYGSTILATSDN